jgi:hypothetical protein
MLTQLLLFQGVMVGRLPQVAALGGGVETVVLWRVVHGEFALRPFAV